MNHYLPDQTTKFFRSFLASIMLVCMGCFNLFSQTSYSVSGPTTGNLLRGTTTDASSTGMTNFFPYAAGTASTNQWSSKQTIPFAFSYYGVPVSKYCVSKNGLLTFDTTLAGTNTTTGLNTNSAIPATTLPNNTLGFWGNFSTISSGDNVWSITYGTAPNRQHLIYWFSYTIESRSYAYFGIYLEESTNKIYIAETYNSPVGGTFTIGLQKDTATGVQTSASPSYALLALGSGASDNIYWTFTPVSSSANAGLTAFTSPSASCAGTVNVTATLTNMSAAPLTSDTIDWYLNGVFQNSTYWTGSLTTSSSTNVSLGSFSATSGTLYNLMAISRGPNGANDSDKNNDTLRLNNYRTSLTGTYTINSAVATSGTNYQTFNAFASDLRTYGICGPVVANVNSSSGPYYERVSFDSVTGSSATNTIRINGNGRTIRFGTNSATVPRYVVRLNGIDYLTIDSLNVTSSDSTYGWCYHILNNCQNVTIRKSTLTAGPLTSTGTNYAGIVTANSSTTATTSGNFACSNINIAGNRIIGGYYGITMMGISTSYITDNVIQSNTFTDQYLYGIYGFYNDGLTIRGNDISQSTRTATGTYYGVYLTTGHFNTTIEKNFIHDVCNANPTSTSSKYGVYLTGASGILGRENYMINNVISDFKNGAGLVYGVYSSSRNWRFFNNTIRLDDAAATAITNQTRGISLLSGSDSSQVRNNIISITRAGSANKYCLHYAGTTAVFTSSLVSNNNALYVNSPGGNDSLVFYAGTINQGYKTLPPYVTATTLDAGSVSAYPLFVSATNCTPANPALNDIGASLSAVTEDVTGAARSATPDPGAYEFNPPTEDAGISSLMSPSSPLCPGTDSVIVRVTNYAATTLNSVTVEWTWDGMPQTPVNYTGLSLASAASVNLYVATISITAGSHTISVNTANPNGAIDLSNANDTVTSTIATGLSGSYTINQAAAASATNFVSFTSLANDLASRGVCGPVYVDVLNGPYVEQVSFGSYTGASSANQVIINGNNDTIRFAPISAARYIVRFNGADNISIKNLNIRTTDATYGWGVLLQNDARQDSIINCRIDLSSVTSTTSSNSVGIVATNSLTSVSSIGNLAYETTVHGCTILGGYEGIHFYGNTAAGTLVNNGHNRVENCLIKDFYIYGIYSYQNDANEFIGNEIRRDGRVTVTTFYGIYVANNNPGILVMNNKIHSSHDVASTTTGTVYGIYAGNSFQWQQSYYVNNLIYDLNTTSGTVYGIYTSGNRNNMFNNTVVLDNPTATSGSTYGYYSATADTALLLNNIIHINRSGTGAKYAYYFATVDHEHKMDYNLIYNNSTNFNYAFDISRAATYANRTAFRATFPLYEANSDTLNPIFAAPSSGSFIPTNFLVDDMGTTGSGTAFYATDIIGATRSATTPDVGVFEFDPPTVDVAAVSIVSPLAGICAGTTPVVFKIYNSGVDTLNTVDIEWSINGVAQTTVPFTSLNLASGDSVNLNIGSMSIVAGSPYLLAFNTDSPNGITDVLNANDTIVGTTIYSSLVGNYTIDTTSAASATNYRTIQSFVADLNARGVCGPVNVDIVAGTGPYSSKVTINNYAGASTTNRVTINGNGNTITDSCDINFQNHFRLNGADYMTFRDLTVRSRGTAYGRAFSLGNNSIGDSIVGVTIILDTNSTNSNLAGIVATGSATSSVTSGTNVSNLVVENCLISGGYYPIVIYGDNASPTANSNNLIKNNTLLNAHTYNIYVYSTLGTTIEGNEISRAGRSVVGTFYGIYCLGTQNLNLLVNKNKVHDTHTSATTQTGATYGIYISSDNVAPYTSTISNNLLYNINSTAGTIYSLYVRGSQSKFYHNTVSLDNASATTGTTYLVYATTTDTSQFFNNIFSLTRGGSSIKYVNYVSATTSRHTFNNNIYNVVTVGSGVANVGYYSATARLTLLDWETATGQDTSSLATNPYFTSPGTGDFTPASFLCNNIGVAAASIVPQDILGTARPLTGPDPGAYEFNPPAVDAGVSAIVSPSLGICPGIINVIVGVTNYGLDTINSVTVEWRLNGVVQTPDTLTGLNILPGATSNQTIGTISFLAGSNYVISANTTLPNGSVDVLTANDTTTSGTITPSLSGTYTINSATVTGGTNFQTFTDMATALNTGGVCGPVVINVVAGSGPYVNQMFTLNDISGMNAVNTVTINGNNREFRFVSTTTSNRPGINLNGTDYLTINDLRIICTGTTTTQYGMGIHFMNRADSNTISGCFIYVDTVTTSTNYAPISFSGSISSATTGGDFGNYNTITGCTLVGGYYGGVTAYGLTTARPTGNRIVNNTLYRPYYYGIYTYYQKGLIFTGNTINHRFTSPSTTQYGVYMLYSDTGCVIGENTIYNYASSNSYGIYMSICLGSSASPNIIRNNMISCLGTSTSSVYGIYPLNCEQFNIYHNSVIVNSTSTTAGRALYINSTTAGRSNIRIRNNTFSNNGGGYAVEISSTAITNGYVTQMDYNNYRTTGTTLGRYGAVNYGNLTSWISGTPWDDNSISVNPNHISNYNLRTNSPFLNNAGTSGLGITTDIDGQLRCPSGGCAGATARPDIGADEYFQHLNDECVGATTLTVNTYTCTAYTDSCAQATVASGSGTAACLGTEDDDVWYKFVATSSNVRIVLDPSSASFDGVIEVDSGSCGSLTQIRCLNSGAAGVNDTADVGGLTIGNTYYVRVYHSGAGSISGNTYGICITVPPTPPGDGTCFPVTAFVAMDYANWMTTKHDDNTNPNIDTLVATNSGASYQAGEPMGSCAGGTTPNSTVWYLFDAPSCAASSVRFSTNNSFTNFNTRLAIYQRAIAASCTSPYTEIACNDNGGAGTPAGASEIVLTPGTGAGTYTPGDRYFVQVSGNGGAIGNYGLVIDVDAPNCAVSSITTTGATITWPGIASLSGAGHLGFYVRYRPSSATSGYTQVPVSVLNNTLNISSLNPGTSYDVWVVYICQDGYWYSPKQTFSTTAACTVTGPMAVPNVDTVAGHCNRALVTWTSVPGATRYRVLWRRVSAPTSVSWVDVNAALSYTATLPYNQTWQIWVQAFCDTPGPAQSVSSPFRTFTTCTAPARIMPPAEVNVSHEGVDYINTSIQDVMMYTVKDYNMNIRNIEFAPYNASLERRVSEAVNTNKAELSVYPNPAENNATVSYSFNKEVNSLKVSVTSMQGQVMEFIEVPQPGLLGNIELNLAKYTSGIYIVRLQAGDVQSMTKLVVNK